MALPKIYNPIIFDNVSPPALNEDNLNDISQSLSDLDDRVIEIAGDVIENIQQIIELSENPPYIGENGNWYVWDTETGAYVDSGVDASITVEIADVTMLPFGATPYVTNTGTATDPIFHLFIPFGNDGDYNNLSNRPKINGTTLSGSSRGRDYGLVDIEPMVAKYTPNTTLVPTGATFEKGALVWCKAVAGVSSNWFYKMLEDVPAGQNWYNKAKAISINDISNSLDAEITTRSELGAHNLCDSSRYPQTTKSNLALTTNGDGTVTISGIHSASGGTTTFRNYGGQIPSGNYICTLGQNALGTTLIIANDNPSDLGNYKVLGTITTGAESCEFEYTDLDKATYPYVFIDLGIYYTNVNVNVTFSPMIRMSTDTDTTYRIFAKTNKNLTDNIKSIETNLAKIEIGTASQAYAKGDYLILNDKLYKATTAIVSGATLIVGTNIEQTSVAEELELNNIQLELTGISTNKGIIEGVFTNVIPLLTRDLMKCSGVVKVPGANSFGFNIFRISSTMYYGFFHANDRVFTAISSSGTVTAYQIVGTAI